jgi:hypothetical protein
MEAIPKRCEVYTSIVSAQQKSRRGPSIGFFEGVVDGALADALQLGNLGDGKGLSQVPDLLGLELFGALLPPLIDAALLGQGEFSFMVES